MNFLGTEFPESTAREKRDELDHTQWRTVMKYAHYKKHPEKEAGKGVNAGLINWGKEARLSKRKHKSNTPAEHIKKEHVMETLCLLMTSQSGPNQVSDWEETGGEKDRSCQAIDGPLRRRKVRRITGWMITKRGGGMDDGRPEQWPSWMPNTLRRKRQRKQTNRYWIEGENIVKPSLKGFFGGTIPHFPQSQRSPVREAKLENVLMSSYVVY